MRYTRVAVVLHWLIAVLILANIALGLSIDRVSEDLVRPVIDTHKSIGVTVLGLAAMRLLWRIGHPPPPFPVTYSRLERLGAHGAHIALDVLIFALPLTGWMHDSAWKDAAAHPMRWFNLFPFPRIGAISHVEPVAKEQLHDLLGSIHTSLAYVLIALFVAHVAGALKHQFIDKERELQRMSLWEREKTPTASRISRGFGSDV